MFEDKPSLDARDLFLHLAALKALLETKKAQLADLEKKKAEQKTAESTEEEKEEGAEMKEDNVEESTAPVADPTASTSALPAVEAPIASEVADVIAATPGVEESDENELAPNEKQTVEEVAAEVDQLGVLLAFVEELFGPTCVLLPTFGLRRTDAELPQAKQARPPSQGPADLLRTPLGPLPDRHDRRNHRREQ